MSEADSPRSASGDLYVWDVAGQAAEVRLSLDVVDRLSQEVMRGFGAMPRRGVEMGGILLGSAERSGDRLVLTIEDFEPVACQHSRGATYLLSDEEQVRFQETLGRWAKTGGKQTYAVGFYRSHTREGLGLAEEDLSLFDGSFAGVPSVSLLVKPFATRVSLGAIFYRGSASDEITPHEFPFRRRELGGGDAAPEPPAQRPEKSRSRDAAHAPDPNAAARNRTVIPDMASISTSPVFVSEELKLGLPTTKVDEKTGRKFRSGWVWIPLSFIFLLLGTVLGFQVALSVRNQLPASIRPDPYSLHLSITPAGDSLHLRWDRSAAPIHPTARGALIIDDGGARKVVPLDEGQLQNGSVVYRRASNNVAFRLEVYTHDRVTVSETMEFKEILPSR